MQERKHTLIRLESIYLTIITPIINPTPVLKENFNQPIKVEKKDKSKFIHAIKLIVTYLTITFINNLILTHRAKS